MSDKKTNQWVAQTDRQTDLFQNHHGKPLISEAGPGSRYVGRVVIELWEVPTHPTSPDQLSYTIDPAGKVKGFDLLQRIAVAFPLHVARRQNK